MSFTRHLQRCNNWNRANYLPLYIGKTRYGYIEKKLVSALKLREGPLLFRGGEIVLDPTLDSFETRSEAIATEVQSLCEEGLISQLRNELFPITNSMNQAPVMSLDRSAVSSLGMRGYGVHLNGYVRKNDDICLWVGKRAPNKLVAPNKLDQIAAGGLPYGLSLRQNLAKEAEEEANIPADLIAKARSVGLISYRCARENTMRDDHLYCYDLELPADFVPQNNDAEMQSFALLPAKEVLEILRNTDDFKFDAALVALHFLIRHGVLTEEESEYFKLSCGLTSSYSD